jgi:hypothetical protein
MNGLVIGSFDGKLGIRFYDMIHCAPGFHIITPPLPPPPRTNTPQPAFGGAVAGFRISRNTFPYQRELRVEMPAWIGIVTTLIFALVCMQLRPSRPARNDKLCGVCGYDLRASKDRCPECGTAVVARALEA